MKKLLFFLLSFVSIISFAQGSIEGMIMDAEVANSPLPFADVYIKGTTKGASTDFDGNFIINNVDAGSYILTISFVGYESKEIPVTVIDEQPTKIKETLKASAAALGEIVVQGTSAVKESETALVVQQKKAEAIVESIGAQQLAKTGVRDASAATQKIAGVTKSEGSSEVFIRGLGDRYLTTTLNGLPVPSDDVNNKNLNLNLFNTSVIQNVGISKTFSSSNYADQASGNVDIKTKKYSKDYFKIGLGYGLNTNIINVDSYRVSANNAKNTLGFFDSERVSTTISNGNWNPEKQQPIGNFNFLLSGAKKIDLFDNPLKITASLTHRSRTDYQKGQFREFQNNTFKRDFNDVELFKLSNNTTALLDFNYKIGSSDISVNSLFINKADDILYEQGRNTLGRVLDQNDEGNDFGAFARDQNNKQTLISVTQFHGKHTLSDNNKLTWSTGYNYVNAQEPNRIRNEVNILTEGIDILADSGFEQRKSEQKIEDKEYNAFIEDRIILTNLNANDKFKVNFGANFRKKSRDFRSNFLGLNIIGSGRVFTESIDDLEAILGPENIGIEFSENVLPQDTYSGDLNIYAGYANFSFGFEKLSGNIGLRYEVDKIDLNWDVTNFDGRIGGTTRNYTNYLPSFNLKYDINDEQVVRFASSVTTTLPEFKEIAPFEYISPSGRGTIGNENLEKSDNYNLDLKYEFYPNRGQVISLASFYKLIKNPINKTLLKGPTGNFTYANTGSEATLFGLELEGKVAVLDKDDYSLNVSANLTKMWTNQDLSKDFQYNGNKESELEGAPDLIFNSAISFSTNAENEFVGTLSTNYSSDKIAVLGASDNAIITGNFFNNEIIEKGFWTVDFVLSKEFFENLKFSVTARNLLDPNINQRQRIVTNFSGPEGDNRLVSNYKKGRTFSVGLNYTF